MLNLSPLFFTTVDDESCMHDELDLTPEQRAWIASARTDVRDCLRTGIPRVLRAERLHGRRAAAALLHARVVGIQDAELPSTTPSAGGCR